MFSTRRSGFQIARHENRRYPIKTMHIFEGSPLPLPKQDYAAAAPGNRPRWISTRIYFLNTGHLRAQNSRCQRMTRSNFHASLDWLCYMAIDQHWIKPVIHLGPKSGLPFQPWRGRFPVCMRTTSASRRRVLARTPTFHILRRAYPVNEIEDTCGIACQKSDHREIGQIGVDLRRNGDGNYPFQNRGKN